MKFFSRKAVAIEPSPISQELKESRQVLVVKKCYCPNGHSLISRRVNFSNHRGLLLKVKQADREGLVGLSPIYGEKCIISLGVDLVKGEQVQLFCPACDCELPPVSKCTCDADFVALYLTKNGTRNDYIGICNRVGCPQSTVLSEGKVLSSSQIESF